MKRNAFVKQSVPSLLPGETEQPKNQSMIKVVEPNRTVGFSEGQKAIVDELLEEEEKKLKKIKPMWKVSEE